MRSKTAILISFAAAWLLGVSCTERRTASDPVPDGDTVEVVIRGKDSVPSRAMPEIIEIPDSIDI